jgi:hypothetical protein
MAEALAIVGVVANIVQLIDFSTKVVHRLDEFTSHAGDVPKCFRHVKTELPLLNITLQQMQTAIDTYSVTDGTRKTLLPVIAGCHKRQARHHSQEITTRGYRQLANKGQEGNGQPAP